MRVFVTGAAGQLGTLACRRLTERGHSIVAPTRTETDVANAETIRAAVREVRPDFIIHCAAQTNVDGCERDPDTAYRVNALGTWALACAAEEAGAGLVAVSTDYVFDGAFHRPYTEWDAPNPISVYGASKLAGETLALRHCRRCWVVRTSWLYGPLGFANAIVKQAQTRNELFVVDDQIGSPTYAPDLADALIALIEETPLPGVYHLSNTGAVSRRDFAEAITRGAGLNTVSVTGISTAEAREQFGAIAPRPPYSALRSAAWEWQGRAPLRSWQEGLAAWLAEREDSPPAPNSGGVRKDREARH